MPKSLRLEADAAVQCQAICDEMLDQLGLALDRAQDLTNVSGFGTFASAIELQSAYQYKCTGGPSSLVERLRQYTEVVTQMRADFVDGGNAYAESDNAVRRQLIRLDTSPSVDESKAL